MAAFHDVAGQGKWMPTDGILTSISVGDDGTAWGINAAQDIFCRPVGQPAGWNRMPGKLTHISCANAQLVVGCNEGGALFKWNGAGWEQLPGGGAKCVSVGVDGTIWCVTQPGQIFRFTGAGWDNVPGSASTVSVGDAANVWVTNAGNNVFRWQGSGWVQVPGEANCVSVSAGGRRVMAVNQHDNIFAWNGSAWVGVSGALRHVSVGARSAAGITRANDIFFMDLSSCS